MHHRDRNGRILIGLLTGKTLAHTGGGAYEVIDNSIIIPGGVLGPNGLLLIEYHVNVQTTTLTNMGIQLNATRVAQGAPANVEHHGFCSFATQNDTALLSRQRTASAAHGINASVAADADFALDTDQDITVTFDALTSTAQNVLLKWAIVEVINGG